MFVRLFFTNYILYIITFTSLILGIFTLYTFSGSGFVAFTDKNIKFLLISNIILIFIFIILVLKKLINFYQRAKTEYWGTTNLSFIKYFVFIASIPSIFVVLFSLTLFNLGIDNWFNTKVSNVVTNSVEVAKNYLEETLNSLGADVSAMAYDLNTNNKIYKTNVNSFQKYFDQQTLIRKINESYLIDKTGKLIFKNSFIKKEIYVSPLKNFIQTAESGKPVLFSSSEKKQSLALVKLKNFSNVYLYTIRYLDPETVEFLKKTGETSNFYYKLKSHEFGLQLTFGFVYLIIVSSLILLSINYAINIANKISKPINKLIHASNEVAKGNFDSKLKLEDESEDFKKLFKTFNNMSDEIQTQKNKIILTERYQAWEMVAKKLAHEIKNPLTPIVLSLESMREKYLHQITTGKADFENYLNIISRQVNDIGKLANEFSDFARMPESVKTKNNFKNLLVETIEIYKMSSKNIKFNLNYNSSLDYFNFDLAQVSRVLLNLFKNSIESIAENLKISRINKGSVNILVENNNNLISLTIEDNGVGFKIPIEDLAVPLVTTKKDGSGLGLSIISKIVHEHGGDIVFFNKIDGAKIKISFKI